MIQTLNTPQPFAIRRNEPLNDDDLMRAAPSIFTDSPHPSRSERYAHISTISLIRALRASGFSPFAASQSAARGDGGELFTKHLVKFRDLRGLAEHTRMTPGVHTFVKDAPEFNEIVLINSHDGGGAYQMLAGRFRTVCLNGLIVGRSIAAHSIPHRGDVESNIIEGAVRVVGEFERINALQYSMLATRLQGGARIAFAEAALAIKYEDRAPITASQLLTVRRGEDLDENLWNTFNVVQENLLRGGLRGITTTGRRTMTRPITGITADVTTNRKLWDLADFVRRCVAGERLEADLPV